MAEQKDLHLKLEVTFRSYTTDFIFESKAVE